jgi:hypothetical protein
MERGFAEKDSKTMDKAIVGVGDVSFVEGWRTHPATSTGHLPESAHQFGGISAPWNEVPTGLAGDGSIIL